MRLLPPVVLIALALVACSPRAPGAAGTDAQFLYLWTASEDPT
jgi:hypothetical protein